MHNTVWRAKAQARRGAFQSTHRPQTLIHPLHAAVAFGNLSCFRIQLRDAERTSHSAGLATDTQLRVGMHKSVRKELDLIEEVEESLTTKEKFTAHLETTLQ